MAIWTVHAPDGDLAAANAADRLVFVREGFSWWALAVPFLWTLRHRLWAVFVGWALVALAIEVVDRFGDPTVATVIGAAFALWFAVSANDLRRWTLERRGLRLVALAQGANRDEAELRFFAGTAGETHPFPSATPPAAAAPSAPSAPRRDLPPIVGFAGLTRGTP
ncbi:DUF2628 domain-containing protein [Siculibacillus lacustris]|nr:DUF2628 domain-containing protein [Siculibacillus lacustris]